MTEDQEYIRYRRKVHLQAGLVIMAALAMIVANTLFFTGTLLYNEFCVWNTRVGLERFNPLRATLMRGKVNKGWQDVQILSPFGYELKGTYLPNPTPSNQTVIFLHGITANRLMGLWYTDIYLKAGYNVLLYDSRAHGESGGENVSYGYYEKYDLEEWVKWVRNLQPGGIIGVHGVSMGAATALQHAGLNEGEKKVQFYVADSAYSDLETLLTMQIDATVQFHNFLWVGMLLKSSSLAAYSFGGFTYQAVSPLQAVKEATTPILYLHGEKDPLVPPVMSRHLYENTKGYREMYTFPKVGHAMAVFERKQQYPQLIYRFMENIGLKEAP